MRQRILICDPDPASQCDIKSALQSEDFEIISVNSGKELNKVNDILRFDLVIIDAILPDETGLSVCARLLNHAPSMSIVFVSAFAGESDIVVGLELGADDYVAKPYRPRELLARIRSVMRRRRKGFELQQTANHSGNFVFDGWRLSVDKHELYAPHGGQVDLSPAEFMMLKMLVSRPKQILSRQDLMGKSSSHQLYSKPQTINVTMSRLRSKLRVAPGGEKIIRTVRNEGYTIETIIKWMPNLH